MVITTIRIPILILYTCIWILELCGYSIPSFYAFSIMIAIALIVEDRIEILHYKINQYNKLHTDLLNEMILFAKEDKELSEKSDTDGTDRSHISLN